MKYLEDFLKKSNGEFDLLYLKARHKASVAKSSLASAEIH